MSSQAHALDVLAELLRPPHLPALDWTLTQTGDLHGDATGYLQADGGHLTSTACVSAVRQWAGELDAEPIRHGHWLAASTTRRGVTVLVQTYLDSMGPEEAMRGCGRAEHAEAALDAYTERGGR